MKSLHHLFRTNIYSACVTAIVLVAGFALTPSACAAAYTWDATSGNWSTPGNWSPNTPLNGPQAGDTANFCAAGNTTTSSSTVNNTVDQNFTISNLSYTNAATTSIYNVTAIPVGVTLTVTNDLKTGQGNYANAQITYAYVTGGGTLLVTGPYVDIWQAGSASGANANSYLNLSGLANFVFNPAGGTGGGILGMDDNSGLTREAGNLTLANGSNYINAYLNLGTSTAAQAGPSPATLTLGPGTNIIYSGGVIISTEKCSFTVQANGGGLLMAGSSGVNSQTPITIADGNPGGGTTSITGQMLLDGCDVNIVASTIIVSEAPGETGSGSATGNFYFDTGTVSATGIIMANNTSATGTGGATGTLFVGTNATLNVGSGGISLAHRSSGGPATGTLIISNGVVNCSGPVGGGTNGAVSSIIFLNSGTLIVGAPASTTAPVGTLNVAPNTTLGFSVPSSAVTNLVVNTVNWPSSDSGVTISVTALPAGINPGVVFPLLTTTNFVGTFVSPVLSLPPGVQGSLSEVTLGTTNTIFVTITGGVGPGTGGVGQLLNPDFTLTPPGADWTPSGGASVVSTSSTYPNTSSCTHDTRNIVPFVGTNVAKLTGSFAANGSTNTWSQSLALAAGSTITAGAFTYVPHEDMMSGNDSFYYEVDFLGPAGNLVAAYESSIVSNLTCEETTPFALDTWNLMAITNQMQLVGGVNTGVVISSVPSTILVPPGTVTSQFKAVFIQRNSTDSGSAYFSGANLGLLANPVPPSISSVTPNGVTLCTNQSLSCTVASTITTISSVKVTATTTTLGGTTTNTTVYTFGSPGLNISGLGSPSATINLALATNVIYKSVSITATDADNLVVSSSTVSFDTLVPTLVIEAADFNFTSNGTSGLFFDTPPDGGLALYTNQVGMQGIDENKITRTNSQSYYRPLDATVIQAAAPVLPSGTEQKFVTAAANGDTNDIEVAIAYDTPGDWQNYSRTFGSNATNSALAGTYNVWCYLATSGSGPQVAFSQVTNNPAETGQLTNFIGNFGGSTFSDNGYFTYVYAPLVDQFGNRVTLSVGSGEQTFRAQIASSDTPNVGFYMLVPVAPIYSPVFLNAYPNSAFEPANEFTFSVGPAQGAAISTNGIGLTINGIAITAGLNYTAISGGGWTGTYGIQSNAVYSVVINVTNADGLTATYTNTFDTFNINNFHWMAVDYDFSTNNGTGSGGSVGDGWTGGLFIDNPEPTGATNAPGGNQTWQYATNSYFGWPLGFSPIDVDPNFFGAVAQQSIDISWQTNTTQDPGLVISNSIYRFATAFPAGDGVGSQIASDSFLLPEFIAARTNTLYGSDGSQGGPLGSICEFNIGYFYTNDWLNYTRVYPNGTFNVWGRIAAGAGAFSGCALSLVTTGVGTSNQTTVVLGSFSDPNPAGWQTYHWVELSDTNGNPVNLQLGGQATLRLTAPTNATPNGNALNPLFFMLAPAAAPVLAFHVSAALSGNNLQISIPTQAGHNYAVWYAPTLTGTWTQVGSAITGDGSVHIVSESASGGQGYYRVTAQ